MGTLDQHHIGLRQVGQYTDSIPPGLDLSPLLQVVEVPLCQALAYYLVPDERLSHRIEEPCPSGSYPCSHLPTMEERERDRRRGGGR